MRQKLLDILKTKPSMVNLGRVLKARDTILFDWVMNNPVKYPKEASFDERVYGIENNLGKIPQNEDGENRKFLNYFEGYGELYPLEPTMENIIKLKDKAAISPSRFKSKYKQLYDAVFQFTSNFREDTEFTERLYCLVNGIYQQDFKFDCYKRGYTTNPYISKQEKELEKQALEDEFLKLANRLNSNDLKFGKKLYSYKKKHIEYRKDLYDLDESLNGIDYIFEPVLEIRSPMVKKSYIEKVLRMDVKEYDKLYPGVRGRCQSSIEKVKVGLHIPDENGITPHQKMVDITKIKMSEIGDDGLTGYERKGIKTKNTHMSNIDENGQNGYQRLGKYRTETVCSNGKTIQENADIKRNRKMVENRKSYTRASKISKKVLKPILECFEQNNLKYHFDAGEYAIFSEEQGKYYFYDLVCSELKIAIEYQSFVHHSDPNMELEEWNTWREIYSKADSKKVHDADITKARELYKNRGYITFWVWEKSHKQDVESILEYINEVIKYDGN